VRILRSACVAILLTLIPGAAQSKSLRVLQDFVNKIDQRYSNTRIPIGHPNHSLKMVPVTVGMLRRGSFDSSVLGVGYDSLSDSNRSACLSFQGPNDLRDDTSAQGEGYSLEYAESAEAFNKKSGIDAAIKFGFGPYKANGGYNAVSQSAFTRNQRSLIATVTVNGSGKILVRATRDARMADPEKDAATFYQQCGDQFVEEVQQSARLVVVFTITMNTSSDLRAMDAYANGSASGLGGGVSGGTNFSQSISHYTSDRNVKVKAFALGYLGVLPVNNMTDMMEFIEKFPDIVRHCVMNNDKQAHCDDTAVFVPNKFMGTPLRSVDAKPRKVDSDNRIPHSFDATDETMFQIRPTVFVDYLHMIKVDPRISFSDNRAFFEHLGDLEFQFQSLELEFGSAFRGGDYDYWPQPSPEGWKKVLVTAKKYEVGVVSAANKCVENPLECLPSKRTEVDPSADSYAIGHDVPMFVASNFYPLNIHDDGPIPILKQSGSDFSVPANTVAILLLEGRIRKDAGDTWRDPASIGGLNFHLSDVADGHSHDPDFPYNRMVCLKGPIIPWFYRQSVAGLDTSHYEDDGNFGARVWMITPEQIKHLPDYESRCR